MGKETTHNVPASYPAPPVYFRPLPHRLSPRELRSAAHRPQKVKDLQLVRGQIRQFMRRTKEDVGHLPDYAKRLLNAHGHSFQIAASPMELTGNLKDAFGDDTTGLHSADKKLIAITATYSGLPDHVMPPSPGIVGHEAGHALSRILYAIVSSNKRSDEFGTKTVAQGIVSWSPRFKDSYARDLWRHVKTNSGRIGMGLDAHLPGSKGGPAGQSEEDAREETFATAFSVAFGDRFALSFVSPKRAEVFRSAFPNTFRAVQGLHRDLGRISTQHTDDREFQRAIRSHLRGFLSRTSCSREPGEPLLLGDPKHKCAPVP